VFFFCFIFVLFGVVFLWGLCVLGFLVVVGLVFGLGSPLFFGGFFFCFQFSGVFVFFFTALAV